VHDGLIALHICSTPRANAPLQQASFELVPVRFYVVACSAVVLSVAALLFSLQEDSPVIAAGAGVIAGLGCYVAARISRGDR
jgi:hypothetical protein